MRMCNRICNRCYEKILKMLLPIKKNDLKVNSNSKNDRSTIQRSSSFVEIRDLHANSNRKRRRSEKNTTFINYCAQRISQRHEIHKLKNSHLQIHKWELLFHFNRIRVLVRAKEIFWLFIWMWMRRVNRAAHNQHQ